MKKMSLKTSIMTALLLCFGISFSNAQSKDEKRKKRPTFSELVEKMDENKDGKISLEEVKGPLKEHFTSIDTDEDGFMSEEEFKAMPKPKGRRERSN